MTKYLFDRVFSLLGILLLMPLLFLIALAVTVDSKGGAFFLQKRVGKGGALFPLLKFRTMRVNAQFRGSLTIGSRDPRVTQVGYILRKYKLDELPQLFNVLVAHMSLVGPRPEVPEFVELYSAEQRRVLTVRPGITDYASLLYFHESDLLAASTNPRQAYIDEIMPAKLALNLTYIDERNFWIDLKIIFRTVVAIFR